MKKKTIIILAVIVTIVIIGAIAIFSFLGAKTANTRAESLYLPEGITQEALVDTLHAHGILEEGKNTKISIHNSPFSKPPSGPATTPSNPA